MNLPTFFDYAALVVLAIGGVDAIRLSLEVAGKYFDHGYFIRQTMSAVFFVLRLLPYLIVCFILIAISEFIEYSSDGRIRSEVFGKHPEQSEHPILPAPPLNEP